MLAPSENIGTCFDVMNLRRILPTDITASALVHLSLLAMLILYSEVYQFDPVVVESIPIDIVAPQDIPEKPVIENKKEPVPEPTPQPDFSLLDKPSAGKAPEPAPPPPTPKPQKQAASMKPQTAKSQPPQSQTQPQVQPQPSSQPAVPAYKPPEPDPSIKYHVLLGLPPALSPTPPPPQAADKGADNFDAPASQSADIASSVVAEFRRHLRACAKLPASLAPSDDVKVKLRVFMSRDGKLAGDPVLIEASASMKGPLLMKGAISAIEACQPYTMLPAERYGEWKVLDLSFTPKDFSGS